MISLAKCQKVWVFWPGNKHSVLFRIRNWSRLCLMSWHTPRTISSTQPRSPERCFQDLSSDCYVPKCQGFWGLTNDSSHMPPRRVSTVGSGLKPSTLHRLECHRVDSMPNSATPYSSVFIDNTDILVNWTWVSFPASGVDGRWLQAVPASHCGHMSWRCQGLAEWPPLMVCSAKEATEGPL